MANGKVELSVEDSGPGVPREKQPYLFKKYHTSLDVITQGNGIGLCLCKNVVRLMKGKIYFDESYDSGVPGSPGARFVVQLNVPPLPPSDHVENVHDRKQGSLSEEIAGANVTSRPSTQVLLPTELSVLFVDDDPILRKLFIRSLKNVRPGWTVKGASSGEQALELLLGLDPATGSTSSSSSSESQCPFDLCFIDQYMATGMNGRQLLGTETVAKLRHGGIDCTLCGLSANDMEHEFYAAGADFFILKPLPFEKTELERELVRITSRIRNHVGNRSDR